MVEFGFGEDDVDAEWEYKISGLGVYETEFVDSPPLPDRAQSGTSMPSGHAKAPVWVCPRLRSSTRRHYQIVFRLRRVTVVVAALVQWG